MSAVARAACTVFVGSIPHDATEERLKAIFEEVGPVADFRIVYDRATGNRRGYAFCEFEDQETALSAVRNSNSFEIGGRVLRVAHVDSEKNWESLKALHAQQSACPAEPMYGEVTDHNNTPEAISKAVASLPPEQMLLLIKQMKLCIQSNPNGARNLLLHNPQLAYALLQTQVIMKIVDPQVALNMLHRQKPLLADMPQAPVPDVPSSTPSKQPPPLVSLVLAQSTQPVLPPIPVVDCEKSLPAVTSMADGGFRGGPRRFDQMDRDMRRKWGPNHGRDMRRMPMDPDLRVLPSGKAGYRGRYLHGVHSRSGNVHEAGGRAGLTEPPPALLGGPAPTQPALPNMQIAGGADEKERAELIMQVLSLSEAQLAQLPPDQRECLLEFKRQIQGGWIL